MGAAIGAGLGLLLGAGMGHLRAKHEQEAEQRKLHFQMYEDLLKGNPNAIFIPEVQKGFKQLAGDEGVQFVTSIAKGRQSAEAHAAQGFGGGPTSPGAQMITSGGASGAPPAAASQAGPAAGIPTDIETLRSELKKAEEVMHSDDWNMISESHQKLYQKKYDLWMEQLKQLEAEQRKPAVEAAVLRAKRPEELETAREKIPIEAAGAAARASAEAPIKIRTAAGEAAASTSARLGIEYSPAGIKGASAKAAAEETARRTAAGEAPLTPKEQAEISKGYATELKTLSDAFDKLVEQAGFLEKQGVPIGSGAEARKQAKNEWIARVNPELARRMHLTAGGTGSWANKYVK